MQFPANLADVACSRALAAVWRKAKRNGMLVQDFAASLHGALVMVCGEGGARDRAGHRMGWDGGGLEPSRNA